MRAAVGAHVVQVVDRQLLQLLEGIIIVAWLAVAGRCGFAPCSFLKFVKKHGPSKFWAEHGAPETGRERGGGTRVYTGLHYRQRGNNRPHFTITLYTLTDLNEFWI